MDKKPSVRVLVGNFHQESNSFNPLLSGMDDFRGSMALGQDVINKSRGVSDIVGGITDAVEERGGECIGAISLSACTSGGPVAFDVVEFFVAEMIRYIDAERDAYGKLRIDGVFLGLHGATQTPEEEDACGYILEKLRAAVGPDTVITVGCDLHANVTDRMLQNADFISGYQTYPHIDRYQTGQRSARLGLRRLLDGEKLHTACVHLPMIVPASGYTNTAGAFREVMELAHSLTQCHGAADFSVFQVQPWLDVSCAASTVLFVAEDPALAARLAEEVARKLFSIRKDCWPDLTPMDDIIRWAYEHKTLDRPVVFADMADSPNGGAVGDSVAAVVRVLELGLPVETCTIVRDAAAVDLAFRTGVGGEAEFTFGASLTPGDIPGPVTAKARVVSLHDGVFRREGKAAHRTTIKVGRAAVITFGCITVLLCERPAGTGDTQVYRHFGIEPAFYDLVVVKANTSFRACYESFALEMFCADSPGACTADLLSLPFSRIPKDRFYPFVPLDDFEIPQASLF